MRFLACCSMGLAKTARVNANEGAEVGLIVAIARAGEDSDDTPVVGGLVAVVHHLVGTHDVRETVELAESERNIRT